MTRSLHYVKIIILCHELTPDDTRLAVNGDALDGEARSVAIVRSNAGGM
jgi:hypothetical protein